MNTDEFRKFARAKMNELELEDWRFSYDRATVRFGQCNYRTKTISMSEKLVEVNSFEECVNTLTHEIAHAIVGAGHRHDRVWANKHRELGGDGRAKYSGKSVVAAQKKWLVSCPGCGMHSQAARKRQGLVCRACHISGRYTYPLKWVENPAA